MPLSYILRKVCQKTGLSKDDDADRRIVLDIIQEAAEELYQQSDYPGSLEECVLAVTEDVTVSLPPFIGIPRAMREATSLVPWKLSSVRPRYHEKAWPNDAFRNWRDKGTSPLALDIEVVTPPAVVVPFVEEPPIQITFVGSTDTAQNISETVTITALETVITTPFTAYTAIRKDRINTCNVSIVDSDDREISVIYNNELEAAFRIMDVSAYPIAIDTNNSTFFLEVLYKKKFPQLNNDNDSIPLDGYDNVIINKAVQLWSEEKGNAEKAIAYDRKAHRTAQQKAADVNKGKVMIVDTTAHPHDQVFRRLRWRSSFKFR